MTTTPRSKPWRIVLWLLPVILGVAGLVAAKQWLDDTSVTVIAAALVVLVTANSAHFQRRVVDRHLDEVQRAGLGVSTKWGAEIGGAVFLLLLLLPPFAALMTSLVNSFAATPGTVVTQKAVVFAMVLGGAGVTLLSAFASTLVYGVWTWRIGKQ